MQTVYQGFDFVLFCFFLSLLVLEYGVESTALCKLGKYPTSELKYISSETLNQDSDMVHEIAQGGDPDLKDQ